MATSIMAAYSAGKQRYLQFCGRAKVPEISGLFASHLTTTNISHSFITVYLSPVRHKRIMGGLHNQFNQLLKLCLHFTSRGIKRKQASTHTPKMRLPITINNILHKIRSYFPPRHLPTPTPCFGQCVAWLSSGQ